MFGTIRKHQTWLWAVIITITIITFVIWFSPDARWSNGERRSTGIGVIDGRPITAQQYRLAREEVRLLYFLNFQKWPEADERAAQMGFDVDNETLTRLVRLAKAREEKIAVSDEAVGQLARRILGPNLALDAFTREYLMPHGLTADDFERFLRNDAAIQQLGAVAGMGGKLITPREAELAFREQHDELAVEGVFLSVSNYLGSVTVSNQLVLNWYSNNMAMFRIPERITVSYAAFHRSNFFAEVDQEMAKVTNLNAIIEEFYYKQGTNLFKDKNDQPLSKDAAVARIKQEDREKRAMFLARKKATEFASDLYDKEHTLAAFEKAALAAGLKPGVSAPFDEVEGPKDLDVAPAFVATAFKLTKEEPVAFQPAAGEEAFYVFALKDKLPSQDPPYEAVREKATAQYRHYQALNLMRQAGMTFHTILTNGLAQGKTFSTLAAGANLKVVSLPAISRSTETISEDLGITINPRTIKAVAFNTPPRTASSFIPVSDGGLLLYVREKRPVDEARLKTELPAFMATLRQSRQNEAVGMWFRKVMEKYQSLPFRKGKAGEGAPLDS